MKKHILLLASLLALNSCVLKKWKDIKAEYDQSTEASIVIWYQTESQSLITKRNDQLSKAYITLPEFNGTKDMTVALKESIERIDLEYDESRKALDSLFVEKKAGLKLKKK